PGDPHYYGTRLDRTAGLIVNSLCRCQNPDSHGNAWAFDGNAFQARAMDGRVMMWKDLANKVLDHYGRWPISREE
ncbi:hypothetical protein CC86DRAFT_270882, partial [Ophiobolus disseminans]